MWGVTGAWTTSYHNLPPETQVAVQQWLHLNHFIAEQLGLSPEEWFDVHLTWAMKNALDYSFMAEAMGGGAAGQGMSQRSDAFVKKKDK